MTNRLSDFIYINHTDIFSPRDLINLLHSQLIFKYDVYFKYLA